MSISFATSCWEKDWRTVLLAPDYLKTHQIGNHNYPFCEKILIINNVLDEKAVIQAAKEKVDAGILSRFIMARDVLADFGLQRTDFNDWQYYNALPPLNAIFEAKGEYLLYLTGDVSLPRPVNWLEKAVRYMEKKEKIKVANLTWNHNYQEAKKESFRRTWNFFVSKNGFSDQMFLVKTEDFKAPIYGEVRTDASHYPRGDVWEKRVFSYMKNRGWERITFRRGAYLHEDGNFFKRQS